jgi:hypothetical protein
MSMRWMIFGLSGALALAACSSQESGSNSSDKSGGAVTGGGSDQPTPSNLTLDPQNSIEPVTLPSPKAVTSIPAAFHGRWGMVVSDCVGAGKGLMTVSGSGIRIGGDRTTLASLAAIGPDTLTAELAYPGQNARRANRLTLLDDGKTLVRQEQQAASIFRYSRCPA